MIEIQNNTEYHFGFLDESTIEKDPFLLFEKWFIEARTFQVLIPEAFVLSTIQENNSPNARVLLMKRFDRSGILFCTHLDSVKAQEINYEPFAHCLFFWPQMERQIRIYGFVKEIDDDNKDAQWNNRNNMHKIASLSSPQSDIIPNRHYLDDAYKNIEIQYQNIEIPRPQNWGGYILKPYNFEFWQGRANRLNDRIKFTEEKGKWSMVRLAP